MNPPSVELVAEVATNHGGSLALAQEFIHRYADAGVTWVKFQITRVRHLRPADPQWTWFQQAELPDDAWSTLAETCTRAGVGFLATVYHADDVSLLAALHPAAVKIGSGEAGEVSLARAIVASDIPRVIVGCGLVGPTKSPFLRHLGRAPAVHFLRTVSRYPCPSSAAQADYSTYYGWSDHCVGLEGCYTAAIAGARLIEKHVYLPNQARAVQPWEASVADMAHLRRWLNDDPQRFRGRWQYVSQVSEAPR